MRRKVVIVLWMFVATMAACDGCRMGCACSEPGGVVDEGEQAVQPLPPVPRDAATAAATRSKDEEVCAWVVVVAHAEAASASETVKRTKAEAKARAEELRRRVVEAGESMRAVATTSSDMHAQTAGALPVRTYGAWPKELRSARDAVFDLEEGEVTPVLETERGFAFFERCPSGAVHLQHILVRYRGAFTAEDTVVRNRAAAKALAEELLDRIRSGEDMAELARQHSEDDASAPRGGYVGEIRASVSPEVDRVAFGLAVGETSGVVESQLGYHILRRVAAAP
jgi:hypothetical protein